MMYISGNNLSKRLFHKGDASWLHIFLIFSAKWEEKFVPDSPMPTIHVATEHVQCTGLGLVGE